MANDLDDAKVGGGRDKSPMPSDLIDVFKFPQKKWVSIRLMPGLMSTAQYWVRTKKKAGGVTKFPTPCPSYDADSQERDSTKYDPWRDLEASERAKNGDKQQERDQVLVQYGRDFWMNAIIRVEQKKEPESKVKHTAKERKSGHKEKDSDSWTPVRGIKLGTSFMGKVKELKGLNTVESTKTGAVKAYAVNDLKFGRDIRVYYDPDKSPADQYNIQLGDKRTPLTEEELALLTYDLSMLQPAAVDEAELKRDFESWASRNGVKLAKGKSKPVDDDEDDSDDEDEDEDAPKSKKKPAKKLADDFDDEDEDGDDEDEDDEPPKKKSKPAAKSKSKPVDDDEDEEDEDEDEPPAKKKPAAKAKAKAKPVDEDDEDDFDEEDDEEDEPPKSKKKPTAKSKKAVDEDDDFDEDEDDEPPAKKKPAAKSKAKPAADEDDDFDEDEEDDEDEPPKKSAKKPAPKAKAKKPADDEDDDFDEDDDEDDEPPAKKKPVAKGKPAVKKKSKPVDDDEDDEDF